MNLSPNPTAPDYIVFEAYRGATLMAWPTADGFASRALAPSAASQPVTSPALGTD